MSDSIKFSLIFAFSLLIAVLIALLIMSNSQIENFEPIRYIAPDLYPTTGPVDMLNMKSFLIQDGYRFQNSLFSPVPINSEMGLAESDRYPNSYRQRTGVFKERMFVERTIKPQLHTTHVQENFADATGGTGLSASMGTITQLNAKGAPDSYLMSSDGNPSADRSKDSAFALLAKPQRKSEINYPNQQFSWGDIIHRFYNPSHHRYSEGIVI
jgi:hypothetical protein